MSSSAGNEDEVPETVEGFRAPEKVSVSDILNKDSEDESLRRYKEQLLKDAAAAPFPGDSRQVIFDTFQVLIEGRTPLIFSLRTEEDIKKLGQTLIVLKEGCTYQFLVTFYVQREIVSGLVYVSSVKRKGIRVNKDTVMIGSYPPSMTAHQYKFPPEECPSGMLARGEYSATTTFTDDDKVCHLKYSYTFKISKQWPEEKESKDCKE